MSELITPEPKPDYLTRPLLASLNLDWEKAIYIAFLIVAIVTRFWGLGDRVMSHDESLHTQFSYQFFNGDGYNHTPLMHGPLLFHVTAVSYWLFGVNDLTARIPVAILGVILVIMPYFLRHWLGRIGALFTSFLFLISPYITYYSRYIRHDIYVIVWAMIVFIAIWHYLRERQDKYLWWFAAGTALMFSTKEVSFIYVAIFGSFLIIRLLPQLAMAPWLRPKLKGLQIPLLLALLGVLLVGGGLIGQRQSAEQPQETTSETAGAFAANPETDATVTPAEIQSNLERIFGWIQIVGVILLSLGIFLTAQALRPQLDNYPEFDLMMLFTTLILPLVSPFLVVMAGRNPLDYTVNRCLVPGQESMSIFQKFWAQMFDSTCWQAWISSPVLITVFFVGLTLIASITVGLWWHRRRWVVAAVIFHSIFAVLFTSAFTNPAGWTSGMVGSLAYWLEQQGVRRGSQPWFYYFFVVPFYEFLPLIFSLLAVRLWMVRQRMNRVIGYWLGLILVTLLAYSLTNWAGNIQNIRLGVETTNVYGFIVAGIVLGLGILYWFFVRRGQLLQHYKLRRRLRGLMAPDALCEFVPALTWWLIVTWVAYSVAGEKMPWLSTHFVIPMGLLSGWYFNEKFKTVTWRDVLARSTLTYLTLTVVFIVAATLALGPIILGKIQFGSQEQGALNNLGRLLGSFIAAGFVFWLWQQAKERVNGRLRQTILPFSVFIILSILTIRFAYMASFPNADYAREFMVYAHGAPATKSIILDQIEELSMRMHGDKSIRIAFGGEGVPWPFTWYMREYPNRLYYAQSPSGNLTEYPLVLVGRSHFDEVDRLLGNNYVHNTYTYLWWPMEEYKQISWNAIWGDPNRPEGMEKRGLGNPNVRQALWDIFFYRDFETYSQTFGGIYKDGEWPLRDDLRLYIRKDALVNLWDYGIDGVSASGFEVPYEAGEIIVSPSLVINPDGVPGAGEGQLSAPRNVAVGPDGRIYVLDSGNARVQVFNQEGEFVTGWGSPGFEPGQFSVEGLGPWGLAVDEAFVYVADTWNHRIQKFTLEGEFVSTFGQSGNITDDPERQGLGLFFGPRDIALVDDNRMLVTDTGHHRIQIIDRDGEFLGQVGNFGALGTLLGQFHEPVSVDMGPDGFVYVTDTWNGRIQQLTSDLLPLNEWLLSTDWIGNHSVINKPYIAVDSGGRVYFTDPEEARVLIYGPNGQYLGRFGKFGTDANSFSTPTGIFIDDQDNIYIADAENNRVLKFGPIYAPVMPVLPEEDESEIEAADEVEQESDEAEQGSDQTEQESDQGDETDSESSGNVSEDASEDASEEAPVEEEPTPTPES